jgi:hypothetical protein
LAWCIFLYGQEKLSEKGLRRPFFVLCLFGKIVSMKSSVSNLIKEHNKIIEKAVFIGISFEANKVFTARKIDSFTRNFIHWFLSSCFSLSIFNFKSLFTPNPLFSLFNHDSFIYFPLFQIGKYDN